ncbi:conserved hypothetical protein [Ricinus communis]|uniref:Uncharacterized protein n=1 Tax=Ricinus communis TaxID=3988 RepID=B9SQG4_RICCO|nr:conserved hypothetical protein [Ricinus communis]
MKKEQVVSFEHLAKMRKSYIATNEVVDELGYFQNSLLKVFGEEASVHTPKVTFEVLYNCSLRTKRGFRICLMVISWEARMPLRLSSGGLPIHGAKEETTRQVKSLGSRAHLVQKGRADQKSKVDNILHAYEQKKMLTRHHAALDEKD